MTLQPFAVAPVMGLIASTDTASPNGVALVNGTPVILSWAVPADGRRHRFQLIASLTVASLETGGEVDLAWTAPDGTVISGVPVFAAGLAAGVSAGFFSRLVKPGTTVTFSQGSALTGGAATLWAELWGS